MVASSRRYPSGARRPAGVRWQTPVRSLPERREREAHGDRPVFRPVTRPVRVRRPIAIGLARPRVRPPWRASCWARADVGPRPRRRRRCDARRTGRPWGQRRPAVQRQALLVGGAEPPAGLGRAHRVRTKEGVCTTRLGYCVSRAPEHHHDRGIVIRARVPVREGGRVAPRTGLLPRGSRCRSSCRCARRACPRSWAR